MLLARGKGLMPKGGVAKMEGRPPQGDKEYKVGNHPLGVPQHTLG